MDQTTGNTQTSNSSRYIRPPQDEVQRLREERKQARRLGKPSRTVPPIPANAAYLCGVPSDKLDPGAPTCGNLEPGKDLAVRVFSADPECVGVAEGGKDHSFVYLTAEIIEATGFKAEQRVMLMSRNEDVPLCKHIVLSQSAGALEVIIVLNERVDPPVLISPRLVTKLNGNGLVLVGLAQGGGGVELHAYPEEVVCAS